MTKARAAALRRLHKTVKAGQDAALARIGQKMIDCELSYEEALVEAEHARQMAKDLHSDIETELKEGK